MAATRARSRDEIAERLLLHYCKLCDLWELASPVNHVLPTAVSASHAFSTRHASSLAAEPTTYVHQQPKPPRKQGYIIQPAYVPADPPPPSSSPAVCATLAHIASNASNPSTGRPGLAVLFDRQTSLLSTCHATAGPRACCRSGTLTEPARCLAASAAPRGGLRFSLTLPRHCCAVACILLKP